MPRSISARAVVQGDTGQENTKGRKRRLVGPNQLVPTL